MRSNRKKRMAQKYSVSASTVNRLLFSLYEWKWPNDHDLPKHLYFDEFKSVQSAKGAMSFLFCDAVTGNIIDIVEDRRLRTLKDYFLAIFFRYAKRSNRLSLIGIPLTSSGSDKRSIEHGLRS